MNRRVILDTNVLISSLINKGFPYLIVKKCILEEDLDLCLSGALLMEYLAVIGRPKFAQYPDFVESAKAVIDHIISKARIFHPTKSLDILKDKNDNFLLELADVSSAYYLVTGNTRDFIISGFGNTKIVSPKEFWEILQANSNF